MNDATLEPSRLTAALAAARAVPEEKQLPAAIAEEVAQEWQQWAQAIIERADAVTSWRGHRPSTRPGFAPTTERVRPVAAPPLARRCRQAGAVTFGRR